jgi:hypothetical protein
MRDVWIWKILRFVLVSGSGNSILRSMRPGRISAGSSDSMRLVAISTLTSLRVVEAVELVEQLEHRALHLVARRR